MCGAMVRIENKTLFLSRKWMNKIWALALEHWPDPVMGMATVDASGDFQVRLLKELSDFPTRSLPGIPMVFFKSEEALIELPRISGVIQLSVNLQEKGVLQMNALGFEVVLE